MILKLKKELELKTQDEIDEILIESSGQFKWMKGHDIGKLQEEEILIEDVLNNYDFLKLIENTIKTYQKILRIIRNLLCFSQLQNLNRYLKIIMLLKMLLMCLV